MEKNPYLIQLQIRHKENGVIVIIEDYDHWKTATCKSDYGFEGGSRFRVYIGVNRKHPAYMSFSEVTLTGHTRINASFCTHDLPNLLQAKFITLPPNLLWWGWSSGVGEIDDDWKGAIEAADYYWGKLQNGPILYPKYDDDDDEEYDN